MAVLSYNILSSFIKSVDTFQFLLKLDKLPGTSHSDVCAFLFAWLVGESPAGELLAILTIHA